MAAVPSFIFVCFLGYHAENIPDGVLFVSQQTELTQRTISVFIYGARSINDNDDNNNNNNNNNNLFIYLFIYLITFTTKSNRIRYLK